MKNSIINLYNNADNDIKDSFNGNVASSLQVKTHYDKVVYDDEWLTKMEETIRYLDNILRNPNRFIVNEEEIVKIELARRITVDSIARINCLAVVLVNIFISGVISIIQENDVI